MTQLMRDLKNNHWKFPIYQKKKNVAINLVRETAEKSDEFVEKKYFKLIGNKLKCTLNLPTFSQYFLQDMYLQNPFRHEQNVTGQFLCRIKLV